MISALLSRTKNYLDYFYDHIEASSLEEALLCCLNTKGHIFLTGVGKSGFIAKKIAMTLVSIGTKSSFLEPMNLLHGDLGIVDQGDVVIMMSKSGFTKELVELVPYLKKRGAVLIACVSHKGSQLEEACDKSVYLPVLSELDQHNLVPTTSTQVQLIFGDILTIAIMNKKGVGLDLYATFHPAGSIGKKLLTKVEELMLDLDHVPFCLPHVTVKDILVELSSKKCGCVIVADDSKALKGIFTDGDLRRSLQNLGIAALEKQVGDLMSKEPVYVYKEATAFEAKKSMQIDDASWINVMPIVSENQVVGILRLSDILKAGI